MITALFSFISVTLTIIVNITTIGVATTIVIFAMFLIITAILTLTMTVELGGRFGATGREQHLDKDVGLFADFFPVYL